MECIKKISDNEGENDKDFMKIKFNSDDDIPLNKVLNFLIITVNVIMLQKYRNIFEKDSKYYPKCFLDECLFEV